MTEVHSAAQRGFSKEAETYARGRPDYPEALIEWLRSWLIPSAPVVDLGAGTGKFTRLLRVAAANVIAIEPIEEMRRQLVRALPEIRAQPGTAQSLPLPDGSVGGVICAQAFHWFATPAALSEIRRVLMPGGGLGLVWNVRDESVDWVAEISAIMAPYEGDVPRHRSGTWRALFPNRLFFDPEESVFEHRHVGTPETVIVDRFTSVSFIAALPPEEKERVAQRLRELSNSHPALRGRETIAVPYQTRAYRCAVRGS